MDNPIIEEVVQAMQMDNPITSNSATSQSQLASQSFGVDSPSSAHTSEYEDAELGTSHATLSFIMHHTKVQFIQMCNLFFSSISKAKFIAPHSYQTSSRYHTFIEMWQYDDR